jgi:hypothetical protein
MNPEVTQRFRNGNTKLTNLLISRRTLELTPQVKRARLAMVNGLPWSAPVFRQLPITGKSLSEQISDRSVVVNGHVQIGGRDVRVPGRIPHLGK